MKLKLLLTLILVNFGWGSANASFHSDHNSPKTLFYKNGEWPLPVKIAPFPIKDVLGPWDMGPDKPIMVIEDGGAYPGGWFVDIKLIDKEKGTIIAQGPGRLIDDILVGDDIQMGATKLYMQLASLVPPKNSAEAKNNEKIYMVYVLDKEDRRRSAQFRIRKITQ